MFRVHFHINTKNKSIFLFFFSRKISSQFAIWKTKTDYKFLAFSLCFTSNEMCSLYWIYITKHTNKFNSALERKQKKIKSREREKSHIFNNSKRVLDTSPFKAKTPNKHFQWTVKNQMSFYFSFGSLSLLKIWMYCYSCTTVLHLNEKKNKKPEKSNQSIVRFVCYRVYVFFPAVENVSSFLCLLFVRK